MDSTGPEVLPPSRVLLDPAHCSTVAELGLRVRAAGDGLVGTAEIVPGMWLPGTEVLRASVLATWADTLTGVLCGMSMPRISVTIDLDLHLYRQAVGAGAVTGRSRMVRAGRTIAVAEAEFEFNGEPLGISRASFMASPNPAHVRPDGGFRPRDLDHWPYRLAVPLAERARVGRTPAGLVEIPSFLDNNNATGAIQGGLLTLAVEEAVRDAAPGVLVTSLSIRYLRGFRDVPARGRAEVHGSVARVDLVDPDGRPGAIALVRIDEPGEPASPTAR